MEYKGIFSSDLSDHSQTRTRICIISCHYSLIWLLQSQLPLIVFSNYTLLVPGLGSLETSIVDTGTFQRTSSRWPFIMDNASLNRTQLTHTHPIHLHRVFISSSSSDFSCSSTFTSKISFKPLSLRSIPLTDSQFNTIPLQINQTTTLTHHKPWNWLKKILKHERLKRRIFTLLVCSS